MDVGRLRLQVVRDERAPKETIMLGEGCPMDMITGVITVVGVP